jgi:acetyl/propionyl-CoA carboxylase alpha subunit
VTPAPPTFRRIAIVNRGEAAMRLIRAVRELNRERDLGLVTIALFTESERRALFVREADEAHCIGSATFVDPKDERRKSRYLDYGALERGLAESGAEAVWVGWGFVAEHAEFAELCRKLGIAFIGPEPEVMRALGDKIGSKRLAEESNVPLAPWSGGPVENLDEARTQAEHLGFPLMVKATAGGGGRGIRRVRSEGDLREAFESARSEALAGFGDATVFMERLVEGARHIEVQIIGDGLGTTWALGVRDCTVQRRNQKVIEESPSPALTAEQMREVCDAAARLGDRTKYRGAGTVEFLYDPTVDAFSFMEVNARLQVEHPVTECTTGVDLVKLQLHVAWGGTLDGAPPAPRGHAIEVRVNAEEPERGFAPAPGAIELLRLPGGPGLRVDSGFVEGDRIPSEFDSMMAKVIAFGSDRAEAMARLRRALVEMKLAVRGGASNRGFLLGLLDREEVRSGEVDVGWLDRLAAEGRHLSFEHADVALVVAAIEAYDAELAAERSSFYAFAARGRLRVPREVGFKFELRLRGGRYTLRVLRVGPSSYDVEIEGRRIRADVEHLGRLERRLRIGAHTYPILTFVDGPDQLVEVDGIPHRVSRDDVGMVRSPAPAVVLRIAVEPGQHVALGDRLAVLEAMKTEMPVLAPCSGVVGRILVSPNVQVDTGAPLLLLEPSSREEEAEAGERVGFDALVARSAEHDRGDGRCARVLEELRRAMLGFDFDASGLAELQKEWEAVCQDVPGADDDLLRGEREILAVFADGCALFEHRTAQSDIGEGEERTPEEYLLLFLRSLDPAAAGVSPSFVARLQRALAHYGVDGLERTHQLEDALLFVCRAHTRIDERVDMVLAILERRLDRADTLADEAGPELREVLDRIVTATTGAYQAVSDLARAVRYRYFDRPFFDRVEGRIYENVEAQLAAAARDSRRSRADRIRALVDCPQPLSPLLTGRLEGAPAGVRELSLEILLRRYYRIRPLEGVKTSTKGDRSFVSACYAHPEGPSVGVVVSHARWEGLEDALAQLEPVLADVAAKREVVVARRRARRSRRDVRSAARTARGERPEPGPAPDRLRRGRARRRAWHEGDPAVHVPGGRGRLPGGAHEPRPASHDGEATPALAALELRGAASSVGGGRLPVPRRGA